MSKKILILTGGGDCPGLNTVIRAFVRAAHFDTEKWQIIGSKRAFNGVLEDPHDLVDLNIRSVAGIQIKGGTILETTSKGSPFAFPIEQEDGSWVIVDRSDELIEKIRELDIDAVINIGGDGSQRISHQLYKKGLNIIGLPKTIDNDLMFTEFTFGFQTAVETATEAVDKLVTSAASHNRIIIAEVMGRDAGWICLHAAVASGAEVALIPEIPYDINKIINALNKRIINGHGFANIVIAEGAKPLNGSTVSHLSKEVGYENPMLGGIGNHLMEELRQKTKFDVRCAVLGHIQRGGTPNSFDRVLANQFGIKAFEMVKAKKFGHMAVYNHSEFTSIPLAKAIIKNKLINPDNYLLQCARKLGICVGD
ncbi:6-phosphofructokinase [Thermoproteota archaeon]